MKKKTLFLLMGIVLCGSLRAQQSYSFQQTTSTYADLIGDTKVTPANFGSGDYFWLDELSGENFWFHKTPFPLDSIKTIGLQTNGNLHIENDSSLIILDGAFTYLDSIDNTSKLSYKIEGGSGNKVLKVQWKNLKMRNGQAGNYMNLQIWIYQASGVIEYRYGASSASNQSGFTISNGPNVGIFYSHIDLFTNPKMYEKLWVNGNPSNITLDSAKNFTFRAMLGLPSSGTMLRFVPRFATGIQDLPQWEDRLQLYPNPVFDKIYLPQNITQWKIYNMMGALIANGEYNATGIASDKLHPGTYLIQAIDKAGNMRATRFIKQ